jgi:glycosyl transferase family 2
VEPGPPRRRQLTSSEPAAVSVIVEWDNARFSQLWRAEALLGQLASQAAELDRRIEVIVVYDPSEVEEHGLRKLIETSGLQEVPNVGEVAIKGGEHLHYYGLKNFGARQAGGDILVFVDSDVIPQPGWLESMLKPFESRDVGIVGGNTFIGPFRDFYARSYALCCYFHLPEQRGPAHPRLDFFANNVSFRAEVLMRHPFPSDSEKFRSQSNESTEYRAGLADLGVWHAPSAQVMHPPPNGLSHLLKRSLLEGYDSMIDARRKGYTNLTERSFRYLAWDLRRCFGLILLHHRKVWLSRPEILPALAFAGALGVTRWVGFLASTRAPRLIKSLSRSV